MGIKEAISSSGERCIQSFDVPRSATSSIPAASSSRSPRRRRSRANLEAKINFG